jgi:hypothetical protein
MDVSVLNVWSFTQCSEHSQSGYSVLGTINGPKSVAADLAITVCTNCDAVDDIGDFASEY